MKAHDGGPADGDNSTMSKPTKFLFSHRHRIKSNTLSQSNPPGSGVPTAAIKLGSRTSKSMLK